MRRNLVVVLATLVGGLALAGCVDERIVYRERPIFEEPAPAAANFVGYSNAESKLTVCGNCHVSHQRRWQETAHAHAMATLDANPATQPFCRDCHSTNARGNVATGTAGWSATQQPRYQDVQCESCHGPGLNHVMSPTRNNWPLAPLRVGTDLSSGCGECHSGEHHPFVKEWAESHHGRVPNQATPGGRAECAGCHTGEDALREWGVRAEYLEKGQLDAAGQHLPITCGVCHDPHDATIPGQLRMSVTVPSEEDNLCMKCHHKRGNPDPTTFRGPHSPEGPVLLGYGGNWFPPMEDEFGRVLSTHGTERNPRLCAGCHVNKYEVRDQLTGAFQFASTGHTFEAIPCVDAQGRPVGGNCAKPQRTYRTCTDAGCHGTEEVARSLHGRAEERILRLSDELDQLLQRVQPNWKQCRGSGNCPGTEFHGTDNRWTVAEGAAFNYELVRYISGAQAGQLRFGAAVHNPVLMEVLLLASIREVRRQYNLPAQTSVSLERTMGVSLDVR